MTTCVRLYLSIYHHRNNAACQHIKDISCRSNVIKECVLLIWHQWFESRRASLGPIGWPEYCHHFALCRCHQNAELQPGWPRWYSRQKRDGHPAHQHQSLSPPPPPPVSEAVIDNIDNQILAWIEERLALRLMPTGAQPPQPTAVLPILQSVTGQLPPATSLRPAIQPVLNMQMGQHPTCHWDMSQISTTCQIVWLHRFLRQQPHASQVITTLMHNHFL